MALAKGLDWMYLVSGVGAASLYRGLFEVLEDPLSNGGESPPLRVVGVGVYVRTPPIVTALAALFSCRWPYTTAIIFSLRPSITSHRIKFLRY